MWSPGSSRCTAGGVIASASAPVVYLQARDNPHRFSEMADCVVDFENALNDEFDDMNQAIKNGETKRARLAREEANLYKGFELTPIPLSNYDCEQASLKCWARRNDE